MQTALEREEKWITIRIFVVPDRGGSSEEEIPIYVALEFRAV